MATIDELIVGLGFEFSGEDKKELSNFKSQIKEGATSLLKMTAVAVGAAAAVTTFVAAVAKSNDEIGKSADFLGENVEDLDSLSHAMEITTGSGGGTVAMLKQLKQGAAAALEGGGLAQGLGRLGISASDANGKLKDSTVLFSEIADKMQGLTDVEQLNIASQLGLTDSIQLLRKGSAEIKELTDEARKLGVVSGKDAEAAAGFNDQISRLWRTIEDFSKLMAASLFPVFKKINNAIKDWLEINQEWLKLELAKAAKVIGQALWAMFKIIRFLIGSFARLTRAVGGADNVMRIFISSFAAFAGVKTFKMVKEIIGLLKKFGPALKPLISGFVTMGKVIFSVKGAVAALATVVFLLLEDIYTFLTGGDSLWGRMLEKFPLVKSWIDAVGTALATPIALVMQLWNFLMAGDFSTAAWKGLADGIKTIFKNLIDSIGNFFTSIGRKIMEIASFIPGFGESEEENAKMNAKPITQEEIEANIASGKGKTGKQKAKEARRAASLAAIPAKAGVNSVNAAQGASTQKKTIKTESKVQIEIKGDAGKINKEELQGLLRKQLQDDIKEGLRSNETGIER